MERKEELMPAYEYACNDCERNFTVYLSLKEYEEKPKVKCPNCESSNVTRKIAPFFAKTSRKS
jgi:putative FmdB family regulatory protein